MMNDICGINCAPLVLGERRPHDYIALAGYANAYRTVGALFSIIIGTNSAPLVLGERWSHDFIALAGYANACRTVCAFVSRRIEN
jgi:hypothetical protein